MSTSPSFEEFSKTYSKRIPQLFSRLDLNSRIEVDKVYNLPILIKSELKLAQEELLKIGSERQIKEIYLIFCYFAYLECKDEEKDLDEIWDDYLFFDDFLHVLLSHITLNRDDKKNYVAQFSSDLRFKMTSDKSVNFIKLLKETGFNFEKSTFAVIFAILIWVKLEKLLKIHESNLKIIRIENHTIYHLASDDLMTSVSAQHQVTSLLIDCVKCSYLFERYEKMIKYGNSEAGKNFKSKVRKEAPKKGNKAITDARRLENEALAFFWKKCREKYPKLYKETFAIAIYDAAKNRDENTKNEIIKLIIKLGQNEKLDLLKNSLEITENSIPDRLSRYLSKKRS